MFYLEKEPAVYTYGYLRDKEIFFIEQELPPGFLNYGKAIFNLIFIHISDDLKSIESDFLNVKRVHG